MITFLPSLTLRPKTAYGPTTDPFPILTPLSRATGVLILALIPNLRFGWAAHSVEQDPVYLQIIFRLADVDPQPFEDASEEFFFFCKSSGKSLFRWILLVLLVCSRRFAGLRT